MEGAPDAKMYRRGQLLHDGALPLAPIGDPVIRGDLACDAL